MKKILHISKYYYPFSGGIEQTARDCVKALSGDYEQKVVAFNNSKVDQAIRVDGVEVIKCGCFATISSQSLSSSYKKRLVWILNDFDPDIVIFHYPNPFVAAILLPVIEKRASVKFVVYWHLDIVKQKIIRGFFTGQNKRILRRADKIICTSPNYIEGSKWLSSVKEKCCVVPSCINVERMSINDKIRGQSKAIRQKNDGKIIIVAVGRHTKYKGFRYLIQASKLLDDNYHIYMIGEGELSEELHKEAEGDEKIEFLGLVDDDKLKSMMFAADIFCFPSITKNEAFGLALAEAMYYEKPAVTFTIPGSGVNYLCVDGETGLEVENRNVKEYAEAIQRLASDSEMRIRFGRAGKKRVTENFLTDTFYENIKSEVANL